MEITLERESVLSIGDSKQIRRQVNRVLGFVPSGASVALEGTPIYLNNSWDRTHEIGYNYILAFARDALFDRGNRLTHPVLLDDYTVQSSVDPRDYLLRIQPPVDRIFREEEFVPQAQELIGEIGNRRVTRSDGRGVILITQSGRVACAVLDAAFQGIKEADFNIVIHPIEFSNEQDEMRAVLLAAKRRLPSTFINIFFKGRAINRSYFTSPEGRTERVL